jgi:hypothetical protein
LKTLHKIEYTPTIIYFLTMQTIPPIHSSNSAPRFILGLLLFPVLLMANSQIKNSTPIPSEFDNSSQYIESVEQYVNNLKKNRELKEQTLREENREGEGEGLSLTAFTLNNSTIWLLESSGTDEINGSQEYFFYKNQLVLYRRIHNCELIPQVTTIYQEFFWQEKLVKKETQTIFSHPGQQPDEICDYEDYVSNIPESAQELLKKAQK